MTHIDDCKIIELYFDRDETAIKETDAKYGRLLFNVSNNILRSPSDAEECVSDTYVSVWNAIPPTRPDCFRNFVCRIARNISVNRLRHNKVKKRATEAEISLEELADVLPDDRIQPDVGAELLSEVISDFLQEINEDARNIFLRKYWFFDSVSDIARMFSFSESKVKSTLYHTRKKLRKYLIAKGVRL